MCLNELTKLTKKSLDDCCYSARVLFESGSSVVYLDVAEIAFRFEYVFWKDRDLTNLLYLRLATFLLGVTNLPF